MYKIVPAERQGHPKEMIIKTAVNHRKTAYSGHFGTPGETRTHYIPLRRRTLYPGEVRGHIQKIFNFAGLQDSNDSVFRRRTLYPTELPGRGEWVSRPPGKFLRRTALILPNPGRSVNGAQENRGKVLSFGHSALALRFLSRYNVYLCVIILDRRCALLSRPDPLRWAPVWLIQHIVKYLYAPPGAPRLRGAPRGLAVQ